jgi:ribosome-associated toxin RatA of RatAB toxin-antitoxin module
VKHVKKSVLLWYSPHEMYELVTAVNEYPKFLPWCERAEVLEHHGDGMTARLHLSYHGVRHAFTTRNAHTVNERVVVDLVDGPFSLLEGEWRFVPLGTPAADAQPGGGAAACKVEFELRYAFSSRALEAVVSPVFDRVANTFVDSFVKRAEQVYGAR